MGNASGSVPSVHAAAEAGVREAVAATRHREVELARAAGLDVVLRAAAHLEDVAAAVVAVHSRTSPLRS
jgi:hypothetical protein